jgi:CheY-specific phosphatase CheX
MSPQLVEDPKASALPDGSKLVRVNFKGDDTRGSLALAASKEFASAMASNLDVTGEQAGDDALKELANITCGLLLRMRPGGGAGFELEPPQMSSAANANPSSLFRDGDLVELEADGQLIAAQIIADDAFYGIEA